MYDLCADNHDGSAGRSLYRISVKVILEKEAICASIV